MEKTCLKCKVTAEVADSPQASCPSCGAIYAKVEEQTAKEQTQARLAAARGHMAMASLTRPIHEEQEPRAAKSRSLLAMVMWSIAAIGAVYAGVNLYFQLDAATSAVQQAAAAATAVAYAGIPHCLARAIHALVRG